MSAASDRTTKWRAEKPVAHHTGENVADKISTEDLTRIDDGDDASAQEVAIKTFSRDTFMSECIGYHFHVTQVPLPQRSIGAWHEYKLKQAI